MTKNASLIKLSKLKQLYFPHDIFANEDKKITKMLYYFRKNIDKFSDGFIKNNFYLASYGLYWLIIQYLHLNEIEIDDIPFLADEFRVDEEFLTVIINNFKLFRTEDSLIISDRVLRNLEEIMNKSAKAKQAVQIRWILSAFNKAYEEFFGEKPVLKPEEIENLKQYSQQIPDFKDKLRDIIYTLKNLKFDSDINFKPCANWLLAKNNLARLLNGEFGKLKHKKTPHEIKIEQSLKQKEQKEEDFYEKQVQLELNSIKSKKEAISYLNSHVKNSKFLTPIQKELIQKYKITKSDLTC